MLRVVSELRERPCEHTRYAKGSCHLDSITKEQSLDSASLLYFERGGGEKAAQAKVTGLEAIEGLESRHKKSNCSGSHLS